MTTPAVRPVDIAWARAESLRYLRRFQDPFTRTEAEELAAEVGVTLWAGQQRGRYPSIRRGLVLIVTRRMRANRLRKLGSEHARVELVEPESLDRIPIEISTGACLPIRGTHHDGDDILALLPRFLQRLPDQRRRLLLDFYGGLSCAALAAREATSVPCVKAQLRRGREQLRAWIEWKLNLDTGDRRGACPTPASQPEKETE